MTSAEFSQGYDKSSSRVLRPPGGASSNIFGDPEPAVRQTKDEKVPVSAKENVYNAGDSPEKVAADLRSRQQTSSVFNTEPEHSPTLKKNTEAEEWKARQQSSSVFNTEVQQSPTPKKPDQEEDTEDVQKKGGEEESAPKPRGNPITGENMPPQNVATKSAKGGFNPITGEAYGPPGQKVHTSTKVRQPPGGASSGLW